MKTNFQMLRELLEEYEPKQSGILSRDEFRLITDTLCIREMDILQLRNLRDFVVACLSGADKDTAVKNMDKISAITHVIDTFIVENGGEV